MNRLGNGRADDLEASMAVRAAWLHYAGGLNQSEVARRLGLTSLKAHRLISRANQEGMVKVYIDGDVAECVRLELEICARFGLDYCEVIPDFDSDELPLRALGIAGAQFLKREIERSPNSVIGIGHGRTLAASVEYLPRMGANGVRFVSMVGGLTRKFSANPYDVIHRLAEKTGAEAYLMPVPFFANTAEDRAILLGQRGVSDVVDLAMRADLVFVGIGTTEQEASLVATGMIERREIDEIRQAGARGEILGHFYDVEGNVVETALLGRTVSLPRASLNGRRMVAVAGGKIKVEATRAVLESRCLNGLITDERTAKTIMSASG